MERQEANVVLAYMLMQLIKENPDQRFGQILQNYGFIKPIDVNTIPFNWENEFHLEPQELLKRVEKKLE